jgi:hypothetical protein
MNFEAVQLAWDKMPSDPLLRQLISESRSAAPIDKAIGWLLDPESEATRFPNGFVVQYCDQFKATHALEGKGAT